MTIQFSILAFSNLDWLILAIYFAAMIAIGLWHFRENETAEKYFLADRSMPSWVLAISIVGSSLSVATFVGAPDYAFSNDLTYLIYFFASSIGATIVAFLFVPRLYAAGTVTVYGYLDRRFGQGARIAAAVVFLLGRFMASGARVLMAAAPLCLLMFDDLAPFENKQKMILAIGLIGLVGTFYTVLGGIRAVIWVDLIQYCIVLGAAVLTLFILLNKLNLAPAELWTALSNPVESGANKLRLIDTSTTFAKPNTLLAAVFGSTFLAVASLALDQDMAQRFLVAKSAARGAASVIASQFIAMLTVLLFLVIGLLLFVFYKRTDLTGLTPTPPPSDSLAQIVYPWFLLRELPPVIAGLAIAGLFAAAQGTMDSAINAMASSAVDDVYYPLRRLRGKTVDASTDAAAPKWAVAVIGAVMTLFAVCCLYLYDAKSRTFLDFALGMLTFSLAGLLGVYCCAMFTRRGNSVSVIAALIGGFVTVVMLQDFVLGPITTKFFNSPFKLAWPWHMPIGGGVSFFICFLGAPTRHEAEMEVQLAR
jgi:SSS family transporter